MLLLVSTLVPALDSVLVPNLRSLFCDIGPALVSTLVSTLVPVSPPIALCAGGLIFVSTSPPVLASFGLTSWCVNGAAIRLRVMRLIDM